MKNGGAQRLTHLALLTCVALTIFVAESAMPPLLPVPGVKLGLSNIVTLYALARFRARDALLVLLARVLLGSLFTGRIVSLLFSAAGGLCCFLAMAPVLRCTQNRAIPAVSVLGALAHNAGQVLAAAAMMRSMLILTYLPVLIISGVVTGLFTGLCVRWLLRATTRWKTKRRDAYASPR